MQEKSVRYALQFWGIDTKGRAVNSLLTFGTLRAARCAAARALFELGPRVHFCIASMKDEDLSRLLAELKHSPVTHQDAPAQCAHSSTRRQLL